MRNSSRFSPILAEVTTLRRLAATRCVWHKVKGRSPCQNDPQPGAGETWEARENEPTSAYLHAGGDGRAGEGGASANGASGSLRRSRDGHLQAHKGPDEASWHLMHVL